MAEDVNSRLIEKGVVKFPAHIQVRGEVLFLSFPLSVAKYTDHVCAHEGTRVLLAC